MKKLTLDEKIEILKKGWGFVDVIETRVAVSGWRVWLVKNYAGPPLERRYLIAGTGLPGNPTATKKFEHSGYSRRHAINQAYYSWNRKVKKQV